MTESEFAAKAPALVSHVLDTQMPAILQAAALVAEAVAGEGCSSRSPPGTRGSWPWS